MWLGRRTFCNALLPGVTRLRFPVRTGLSHKKICRIAHLPFGQYQGIRQERGMCLVMAVEGDVGRGDCER